MPVQAKASGNYLNSVLAKLDALRAGFDDAILLGKNSMVSEGTGENIFVVKDGEIATPPITSSILVGITRDSVIQMARDMGMKIKEREISRIELYQADEVFFTGTAAEVTAIPAWLMSAPAISEMSPLPPAAITSELRFRSSPASSPSTASVTSPPPVFLTLVPPTFMALPAAAVSTIASEILSSSEPAVMVLSLIHI